MQPFSLAWASVLLKIWGIFAWNFEYLLQKLKNICSKLQGFSSPFNYGWIFSSGTIDFLLNRLGKTLVLFISSKTKSVNNGQTAPNRCLNRWKKEMSFYLTSSVPSPLNPCHLNLVWNPCHNVINIIVPRYCHCVILWERYFQNFIWITPGWTETREPCLHWWCHWHRCHHVISSPKCCPHCVTIIPQHEVVWGLHLAEQRALSS